MNINTLINYLKCPYCSNENLELQESKIVCQQCQTDFEILDEIPIMFKEEKLNTQEKSQIKHFNQHYQKSSNQISNWQQSMLNRVFNYIDKDKIKIYLDAGCGADAYTVITAAQKNNWLSFGINISFEAMRRAKHQADQLGLADKTVFIVCSIEKLPFKDNFFDYISSLSVLEHIQDDKLALNNLKQTLNPKGSIYICVPNTYQRIYSFLRPIYKIIDHRVGHLRHYSLADLNDKLTGLKLEKYFYNGHLIKLWQLILEKLHLINNTHWWRLEEKDINQDTHGLQLNAIYKKQ